MKILPLETIGNVIACVRALLARKNDELPIPHIKPISLKRDHRFLLKEENHSIIYLKQWLVR